MVINEKILEMKILVIGATSVFFLTSMILSLLLLKNESSVFSMLKISNIIYTNLTPLI